MSKLGRNRKGKIAVILLSALACSANTSAKNFGVKNFGYVLNQLKGRKINDKM